MEDFQVLVQFLSDSKDQLEQEIHSVKGSSQSGDQFIQLFGLIQQSNLLGTLIELPKILLKLKEQFEQLEEFKKIQAAEGFDPLNQGE